MSITKTSFGETDGCAVYCYTLDNGTISAEILNYGGIVKNLYVPDKDGNKVDVVLGRDTLEDYLHNDGYLGALIGRHANRIAKAKFTLNGVKYKVGENENGNSLHGGNVGFDKKVWEASEQDGEEPALILTLTSPDGDEGFPGKLDVTVTYTLTKENALKINYRAVSDKDTVVNLTNHSYFNLAGHDSGNIYDHLLRVNSGFYTPNDDDCLPTGEIRDAFSTPFDFYGFRRIGDKINCGDEQLEYFGGFDHNYAIDGRGYRLAASLWCRETDIIMEVYTDKPGVQIYTSNALEKGIYKNGAEYGEHQAVCLETQYFPNSMMHTHFPSPVLKAGEEYDFTTEYRFSVNY